MKPALEERANELGVGGFVERLSFNTFPQDFKTILALRRQDVAQSLEQPLLQLTKAVPLTCKPVIERERPVERETFEKLATEQRSQRLEVLRRSAAQRRLRVARKRESIDVQRAGVDLDLRAVGDYPDCFWRVDKRPQLG